MDLLAYTLIGMYFGYNLRLAVDIDEEQEAQLIGGYLLSGWIIRVTMFVFSVIAGLPVIIGYKLAKGFNGKAS